MKRKLMIMFALVLALSVTACTKEDETVVEGDPVTPVENTDKPEEKPEVVEPEVTPDAPVDQVSDKWPEEFMPTAPKLEGDLAIVKEEGPNKYFLELKDIKYEDAKEYVDSMKSAGFTENTNENINENNINYKGMDSQKNLLVFHWDKSGFAKIEMIKTNN